MGAKCTSCTAFQASIAHLLGLWPLNESGFLRYSLQIHKETFVYLKTLKVFWQSCWNIPQSNLQGLMLDCRVFVAAIVSAPQKPQQNLL